MPEADSPDEMYPTTYVAAILAVSTETVREWIKAGKLKATNVNGYWRVPRSEVIRIANDRHG